MNSFVSLKTEGETWRAVEPLSLQMCVGSISGTEPCHAVLCYGVPGQKSYFQTPGMKGMFSLRRPPVQSVAAVGDTSGVNHIININKHGICRPVKQMAFSLSGEKLLSSTLQ